MRVPIFLIPRKVVALILGAVCALMLVPSTLANKVISTPARSAVVVSDVNARARVCYYEDKAYSLGAVLNISGVLIECISEQDFELNGSLKWKQLDQKSEPK
ncbi:DUF1496 domain-containing protein [Vibrio sp. T187]|uniref:DUF1496 domain-containing protein n=2 Tax=Vibrio TaxID=662 RepID=UPI0010C98472|nr:MULTISPECIES: DUF1496 domain-containing protein [Vibrio]MBW3695526.1 DUF1496 domain-containing protein [Vibrio sp. T187]